MTQLEIPDEIFAKSAEMFAQLKLARKDAEVFGVGIVTITTDGTLQRLNPIGVKINYGEAMKP